MADYAGLCAGVKRALDTVDNLLCGANLPEQPKICMWGPIIHNRVVMEGYVKRGVIVTENIGDLPAGCVVVFRAHGVSPEVARLVAEAGFTVVDCTCPHVRASQLHAKKKADEGFAVVLIGDREHPEIIGINGWANGSAIIAGSFDELIGQLDREDPSGPANRATPRLCVISQTTYERGVFYSIVDEILKRYPDSEVFDTICHATTERQLAAKELARDRDAMIIIGSPESSNARQLFKLCKQTCGESYMVDTADDMPPAERLRGRRVGVTAGASTPDWIIEEVKEKMDEMTRHDGDINFAEEMERPLITLQTGQTVKGRIIRYSGTEVAVDLGYKSDGVIPIDEFVTDADQDPAEVIKIDDIVDVYVVRVNDNEGTVLLSKKRVDEKNNWTKIEEAFEKNAPIKAIVTDVTNGGLIVTSSGVRIFVPASQVSDRYVEDLRGYLRKPVELRIIDYNKQKRKFVGSIKVLIIEEKRRAAEDLWNDIEIGREYDGVVKSLTAFGAFVDIGGVDGLVHISELSWSRIKHPSDVVKAGEKITVRVVSLDRDKKKISLGYRRDEDNPWFKIEEKYAVGTIVTKKVVRIAPFGAFVELERGIDALVHVSQISDTRIAKPDDVLRVGMEVTAKITELNLETKKISMSIKEVEPIPYIPAGQEGDDDAEAFEEALPTEYIEDMHTTIGDVVLSGSDAPISIDDEPESAEPPETAPGGAPEQEAAEAPPESGAEDAPGQAAPIEAAEQPQAGDTAAIADETVTITEETVTIEEDTVASAEDNEAKAEDAAATAENTDATAEDSAATAEEPAEQTQQEAGDAAAEEPAIPAGETAEGAGEPEATQDAAQTTEE